MFIQLDDKANHRLDGRVLPPLHPARLKEELFRRSLVIPYWKGYSERHIFIGLSLSGVLVQMTGADMSQRHSIELPSHDFLSTLARIDPEGYESLRSELIKQLIDSSPERMKPRLRGMQFRIDCERQLSHSALGMTVKLYGLMWESFSNLNESLQDFINPETVTHTLDGSKHGSGPVVSAHSEQSAQVLEFRPRHES